MGFHHVHPYVLQLLSFGVAASIPGLAFLMVGGAWWEALRRRRGRTYRPGNRRAVMSRRFLPTPS